ncbi:MAG: LEA type 2 family protein [Dysgonomonas sp.]
MKLKLIAFAIAILTMTSCGTVGNDLMGAYNMTQCEYSYNSISNLSVSGINLGSSSSLSVTNIAKLTSILSGTASSIPLNFTVNMNVKNPNSTAALLNGLQYNVKVDGINFTNGTLNKSVNIASGATQSIPLTIGVDVKTLMANNTQSSVLNIVKNFIGIGSDKSNVTVDLKPSFNVGGQVIASPVSIPVSFTFGGK